jgi:hypothetical protein
VIDSIGVYDAETKEHAENALREHGGFPHHLAMATDDVGENVPMLCTVLDVEYVSPHD